MDLFIETLTGTAFELKVSPNDTVMSIKSKIQRVEGIPIGQQHLIWQNGELSDHQSLRDCSIPGGATLRLVLGLRGGPVNAYRTPAALRLTPLHFAPPSFERITPPPRSSSNSTTTGPNKHSVAMSSQQTYVSSSPVITQPPTAADEISDQNNAATFESNTTSAVSPALGRSNVSNESSHPTATSRDVLTQPDTSSANRKHITFVIFDSGDNLNLVHVIDRSPVLPHRNPSVDRSSDSANQLKPTPVEDRAVKAKSVERHPCDSSSFASAHSLARLQAEPAVNRDSEDDNQPLKAPAVLLGTPSGSSSQSKTLTNRKPPASKMPASVPSAPSSPPSPSTPSSAAAALLAGLLYAAGSRSRDPVSAAEDDVLSASDGERSAFPCSYWLLQPPDISRISDSIFPPLFPTKKTPPGIESGGGRLSRPLSIPKVTSRETTESSRKNPPPDASQKELRLPLLSPGHVSLQSQGLAKGSQWQSTSRAAEEPVAPKSRHDMSEPPTNRKPTQAKANRCASCNRKTGLSNSYTCRCGNNFCSRHRYAELHSCPYDYKAEARRCLRESNPVITATKLPKI
nr:unnamed protein product [Spirometra erinaceieuropaei]